MEHCPSATTASALPCDALGLVSSTRANPEAGSEVCSQAEDLDSLKVVRILLVDDSPPFRSFVRGVFDNRGSFQVIGEASDGLEAVRLVTQLKPDLILLDIGLPKLNGIEAAKQIRQVIPGAKILFLTLNDDPDVAQAALSDGANGYVLKIDAASELWPAVEAVLQGKQFVSSSVVRRGMDSN